MVELQCPNCGADVELHEVDVVEETTTFAGDCPACRFTFNLTMKEADHV
jgi:C4-type Zn-finger protein